MAEYNIKQVIVINMGTKPKMRKGKLAAQAAHASMKVFFDRGRIAGSFKNSFSFSINDDMRAWIEGSFAKIVLGVSSEEDLFEVYNQAEAADLPCAMITDAGNTEFGGIPTNTAVAIGPAKAEEIDKITKNGSVQTKLI